MHERPARMMSFGWEGDNGVGEMLIRQIIAGEKWATCGFREAYEPWELKEVRDGVGKLCAVVDRTARWRCTIRITDAFECTFGDPDPRLVAGEGDGDDVAKFQHDHRIAWMADFEDMPLTDDALLVVELFELVSVEE